MCVSVVLGLFKRIGTLALLVASGSVFALRPDLSYASSLIQLPEGLDWSSTFSDLVSLVTPFAVIALIFGAYTLIKRALNKV